MGKTVMQVVKQYQHEIAVYKDLGYTTDELRRALEVNEGLKIDRKTLINSIAVMRKRLADDPTAIEIQKLLKIDYHKLQERLLIASRPILKAVPATNHSGGLSGGPSGGPSRNAAATSLSSPPPMPGEVIERIAEFKRIHVQRKGREFPGKKQQALIAAVQRFATDDMQSAFEPIYQAVFDPMASHGGSSS